MNTQDTNAGSEIGSERALVDRLEAFEAPEAREGHVASSTPNSSHIAGGISARVAMVMLAGLMASGVATLAPNEADAKCKIQKCDQVGHRLARWRNCDGEEVCKCIPDKRALEKLLSENQALRDSIARTEAENAKLKRALAGKDSMISDLNTQLSGLRGALRDRDDEISALQSDASALRTENLNLKYRLTLLESENNELRTRIAELEDKSGLRAFVDASIGVRTVNNQPVNCGGDPCVERRLKTAGFPITTDAGLRYDLPTRNGLFTFSPGLFARLNHGSDGEFSGGGGIEARATLSPEQRRVLAIIFGVRGTIEGNSDYFTPNGEVFAGLGARFSNVELMAGAKYSRFAPHEQEHVPSVMIGVSGKFPGTGRKVESSRRTGIRGR